MGIAFIQDKLEIKFLILYIASRLTASDPGSGSRWNGMCSKCAVGMEHVVRGAE